MFRFVRFIPLALAVCALPTLAAQANPDTGNTHTQAQSSAMVPPEDRASAEQVNRLFDLMQLRDQLKAVFAASEHTAREQGEAQMHQYLASIKKGGEITPTQERACKHAVDWYVSQLVGILPAEEQGQMMIDLYRDRLSREDVAALIAFYSSPAGQHLTAIRPVVLREFQTKRAQIFAEKSPRIASEFATRMQSVFSK